MTEKPHFISEQLNPFAAMLVGQFFSRVEWEKEHGTKHSLEDECQHFWFALDGLVKIGIATNHGDKGATHFSIAVMNETQRVADYIESVLGRCPIKEKW